MAWSSLQCWPVVSVLFKFPVASVAAPLPPLDVPTSDILLASLGSTLLIVQAALSPAPHPPTPPLNPHAPGSLTQGGKPHNLDTLIA